MKKSKIVLSLVSIVLSAVIMLSVFSSNIFSSTISADVTINGVSGKIRELGKGFLDIFTDENGENNHNNQNEMPFVFLGGYPVGLKLYARGVIVVGTENVDTKAGNVNVAEKYGIKVGDIIKKVNGEAAESNLQVSRIIEKSSGEEIIFTIERNSELFELSYKTEFSISEQKYKAGLWIRDSSAGIGTVTFCTEEGMFASLGHGVCDVDTKMTLPISQGECTNAKISGFIKAGNGFAGELCGYLENTVTGVILANEDIGVYGFFKSVPENAMKFQVARADEVYIGDAEIYTTIENGVIERFSVVIEAVNEKSEENKNLVIRVTDRSLIEKTGGIIQGMSGSPIIQNGKLIGAVTHVFLNDATGGFGIFAETMLENVQLLSDQQLNKAS